MIAAISPRDFKWMPSPLHFPHHSIFFHHHSVEIKLHQSCTESRFAVSSIVLRISLPQFNFYSHAANDEERESKWCKRGLFRRDKWRDGKLCVEMVVSEKLIGGLAVSVSLLPRDLSPLSFLPSLFSPFLFRLCHSTPGLSGSRAGIGGWAEKLERRERSKRREKERRKSGEDRLYSIRPPSARSSSCTTCAFEPATMEV